MRTDLPGVGGSAGLIVGALVLGGFLGWLALWPWLCATSPESGQSACVSRLRLTVPSNRLLALFLIGVLVLVLSASALAVYRRTRSHLVTALVIISSVSLAWGLAWPWHCQIPFEGGLPTICSSPLRLPTFEGPLMAVVAWAAFGLGVGALLVTGEERLRRRGR